MLGLSGWSAANKLNTRTAIEDDRLEPTHAYFFMNLGFKLNPGCYRIVHNGMTDCDQCGAHFDKPQVSKALYFTDSRAVQA